MGHLCGCLTHRVRPQSSELPSGLLTDDSGRCCDWDFPSVSNTGKAKCTDMQVSPKACFLGPALSPQETVSGAGQSSVGPAPLWEVVNSTGFETGPKLCIPSLPIPICVTLGEYVLLSLSVL